MNNKLTKTAIIIFTLIFALRVITIFAADRLYSMSLSAEEGKRPVEQALNLLTRATKLDSTNADLYYQKYLTLTPRLTTHDPKLRLQALKHCINLVPSWAVYHLYYGLMLEKMFQNPNSLTSELILSELQKATKLKPSSELYKKIYQKTKQVL